VSRWHPAIESHSSASKAAKMGVFAALGFAAWIGIPTVVVVATGHVRMGIISPVSVAIAFLLVTAALFAAWRFRNHKGRIVGPVVLVAVVVEVIKRLALTIQGFPSIGVFDAVFSFMIFFGLLNGIRGVRALRHLSPGEDLADVFQ
jgi:hypothetical protein